MPIKRIGQCVICRRECSQLDYETSLCPRCLLNPRLARERHAVFVASWLKGWILFFALCGAVYHGYRLVRFWFHAR